MSELRHDPWEDGWVVVAPDRARRPRFVAPPGLRAGHSGPCPFCPGQEALTRPALAVATLDGGCLRYRRVEAEDLEWRVRVVPNRYPMLAVEPQSAAFGEGLQQGWSGVGAHEVVIEHRVHERAMADFEVDELAAVLQTWRERLIDLYRDRRMQQVLVFRNQGALAGATVPHAHSQIAALSVSPARHRRLEQGSRRHFEAHRRLLLDDLCRAAREEGTREQATRVLIDRDGVVVFAPWASMNRYECWLCMPDAAPCFADLGPGETVALAAALRELLRRMRASLGDPPMNLGLFVEPNPDAVERAQSPGASRVPADGEMPWFRWHLRVIPRLHPVAGFEWMADVAVNTTLPEVAVQQLAGVDADAPWVAAEPEGGD